MKIKRLIKKTTTVKPPTGHILLESFKMRWWLLNIIATLIKDKWLFAVSLCKKSLRQRLLQSVFRYLVHRVFTPSIWWMSGTISDERRSRHKVPWHCRYRIYTYNHMVDTIFQYGFPDNDSILVLKLLRPQKNHARMLFS